MLWRGLRGGEVKRGCLRDLDGNWEIIFSDIDSVKWCYNCALEFQGRLLEPVLPLDPQIQEHPHRIYKQAQRSSCIFKSSLDEKHAAHQVLVSEEHHRCLLKSTQKHTVFLFIWIEFRASCILSKCCTGRLQPSLPSPSN